VDDGRDRTPGLVRRCIVDGFAGSKATSTCVPAPASDSGAATTMGLGSEPAMKATRTLGAPATTVPTTSTRLVNSACSRSVSATMNAENATPAMKASVPALTAIRALRGLQRSDARSGGVGIAVAGWPPARVGADARAAS